MPTHYIDPINHSTENSTVYRFISSLQVTPIVGAHLSLAGVHILNDKACVDCVTPRVPESCHHKPRVPFTGSATTCWDTGHINNNNNNNIKMLLSNEMVLDDI